MQIGLSLIPYYGNQLKQIFIMAQFLNINQFEIPFNTCEDYKCLLGDVTPFSIHAPKNLLDYNYKEFCSNVIELGDFSAKIDCKRIVFHPSIDHQKNQKCFYYIKKIFPDFEICVENTLKEIEELVALVKEFQLFITWDCSHAAFHQHYIGYIAENIKYFHVRGYSKSNRYISLVHTEETNIIPKKIDSTFILEYPYRNLYELCLDYKKLQVLLES